VKSKARFWFEAGMSSLSGFLFVVTLLWRDWIELGFHVDPDRHDGSLEWLIVGVLFTASICFGALAVDELRRSRLTW
jgi:hypothetical protein